MAWNDTARTNYRPSGEGYTSDISDDEWLVIEPLLPAAARTGRPRVRSLRLVLEAIFHVLVSGCQ